MFDEHVSIADTSRTVSHTPRGVSHKIKEKLYVIALSNKIKLKYCVITLSELLVGSYEKKGVK